MGDLPVDAQRVVDELRAARRATKVPPRGWLPSESFEATLGATDRIPVVTNENLQWMHHNWDLGALLAPPPARGLKGAARRVLHRLVMAVLAPYFQRLQDFLAMDVRATDLVSKRVDELSATQLRMMGAIRHDMIDFAHHVDEQIGS